MNTLQLVIEILGTFAFAISGIRWAAYKRFDWFGGYVIGLATAIGGGTIRDVMLGIIPFWMTSPLYLICTAAALASVIAFKKVVVRFANTWFLFDTLGLALFTVAGLQKTLIAGHPLWVAIIMGCITGAAGGVIRDVLINEVPLIFRKEIYATACIMGGVAYHIAAMLGAGPGIMAATCFTVVVVARLTAVKMHISLPHLKETENDNQHDDV